MGVKKQPLLYCMELLAFNPENLQFRGPHLLKLVTGVEISTRPVSRSGSPGKDVKRRRRTAAAALKRAAFRLSILILRGSQHLIWLVQGLAIVGSLEFEILVQVKSVLNYRTRDFEFKVVRARR